LEWSSRSASIGYDDNGIKQAWIIQLKKISKIPVALKTLLASDRFKFVGVNVGADVKALEKKYRTALEVNTLSLGVMARDRNVVMDGRVGLKELSRVVLNENMSKDSNVWCSEWPTATLESVEPFSTSQRLYAAFDVIKPLEIFDKLEACPT
jgi:hypothetical protein